LVEAAALGARSSEARWHYEQAVARFSPDRVLADEARCLAPGDRYLLARMSRLVAPLYAAAGQAAAGRRATAEAERLSRPDPRGICVTRGPLGRRSPEEVLVAYWQSREVGRGGEEPGPGEPPSIAARPGAPEGAVRAQVARVTFLAGGEREVVVGHEVRFESARAETLRCATARLRFTREGWLLAGPPRLAAAPCQP
jgi:hypothetical protein